MAWVLISKEEHNCFDEIQYFCFVIQHTHAVQCMAGTENINASARSGSL